MEENVNYEEARSGDIFKIGLTAGIIQGIILIIFNIIAVMTGWAESNPISFFLVIVVSCILLIIGIVYSHVKFKKQFTYMTYGQGLGLGVLVSLFGGLILSIFSFIYYNYVDNEFMARLSENSILWMENQGADSAQIEEQFKQNEESQSNPLGILSSTFIYVFVGFILTLIVAAITKKNEPIEDF